VTRFAGDPGTREIVDDSGRVRASLSVFPENPKVIWKGRPYPETVLLRLLIKP
jgi:hypothetical protein